jgi:hypothetical protein
LIIEIILLNTNAHAIKKNEDINIFRTQKSLKTTEIFLLLISNFEFNCNSSIFSGEIVMVIESLFDLEELSCEESL